ncbi:MAG: polysaccharide biosynthesis/export family protein [Verrucomicrobiota bacterium]
MKTLLTLLIGSALGLTGLQAQVGELPLRKGDRITVSVGGIPDNEIQQLRGVYTISDDGTIPLLYIGNVRAVGLKPSSLQRTIEQNYINQEIYTRPTVVVSIDGGESTATMRTVMITGVNKPGAVPYKQGMTLSQAIMTAGGPTPFGSMKKVKLIRSGQAATIHNLSSNAGNPSVDVQVQPEDQIIVPE